MKDYQISIKIAGQLMSSFQSAIKGAQSGLSGLGAAGKVGKIAMKGVSIAAKATAGTLAAAGGAIAGIGAYSVKVGKEFESQMSTVQSIVGTVADSDLPAVEQAAKDMGLSFQQGANSTETAMNILNAKAEEMGAKTSFSATEAGKAMEYMAMAGWKSADMLNGIEGIMNLAAATGEDLGGTSDIVTDALTAFGLTASDTNAFVDDLAQAARSSNTDVSMMGESFKQAATAAGALGYDTKDVAVALGAMANNGIKGEKSGTMLAKMFSRMSGTNKNATEAMQALGLSMFNSDGSARELSDVLTDMRNAFSVLTDAQKENYAYQLGGQSAMSGILAIVNSSEKDWNNLTAAIENSSGAAAEMAAIKLDNLEGDITLLKSAAEGFGISIYKNLNEPFRGVVQYAKDQLGILQEALNTGGFDGLASALGSVIANGIGKIAENAPKFVDMAASLVDSLVTGINNNAPAIGASMAKLATSLVNALLKIVPRVITTGAHVIVEFAKGIMDHLPEIGQTAVEAVKYLMDAAKKALKGYVNFLGDDEVEPFKKIIALIPAVVAGFAGFSAVDGAAGGIKGLIKGFTQMQKAAPGVKSGLGGISGAMSPLAKNILAAGAGFALAAGGIFMIATAAIQLSNAGPGAVAILVGLMGGIAALIAVAGLLGPALSACAGGFLAFGGSILMAGAGVLIAAAGIQIMTNCILQLTQAGAPAIAAMALMAAGLLAFGAAAGAMSPLMIAGAAGLTALAAAVALANLALRKLATNMTAVATAVRTIATSATAAGTGLKTIKASVTGMGAPMKQLASALKPAGTAMSTFAANVQSGMSAAQTAATTAMTQIRAAATTGISSIRVLITSGMIAIVAVVRSSGAQMIAVAVSTASGIRSAFTIDLSSSGRYMMQGLVSGMRSMQSEVNATAARMAQQAHQSINSALKVGSPSKLLMQTGQFAGEGLAIGMQNEAGTVRTAAQAMTQPVQAQSQQIRDMSAPTAYRSGAIGDTVDALAGNNTTNTTNTDASSMQITYSPQIIIQGGAPDEDTIIRANKIGLAEFEKLMNQYTRKKSRTQFRG